MTYFIDTNFFLQCKKYDQLNWSEITNDKDITILITRPVQNEIDKLKNDGNSRRSRRARETTSLFREILAVDNLSFLVKTKNNNITFKFAKQYSEEILSKLNPSLDMSNNDDRILAILNNYILDGLLNIESCAFLSNDTNPILTARLNGIPVIQIPDSWLLDPENDDKDKEILKLRQQVSEYQKKEPIFEIKFNENDNFISTKNLNEFDVLIHVYNQIKDTEIDELVDLLEKKHPQQGSFKDDEIGFSKRLNRITNPMQTYYPPDDDEIKEYNAAYQNWKNDIHKLFFCYADKRNKYAHIIPFEITLKNIGNISAENLLLIFEILSGGQLVSPDFDDKVLVKRWAYPTPPDPPTGKWKNNSFFATDRVLAAQARIIQPNLDIPLVTLRDMININKRDKNSFYWKDGRPKENTSLWQFECEEFRHKLDGEPFPYYLVFNEDSEKIIYSETKNDIQHLVEYGVTEEMMEKIEGKDRAL